MITRAQDSNLEEWIRGYWFEFQGGRLAGGVSAQTRNVEGGLGAVYVNEAYGLTGYLQYSLPFVSGRVQVDVFSDLEWIPQVAVGVPLEWRQLRLEPHLHFTLGTDEPVQPSLGLRLQYLF
ncbi:MAG TPA: hypothetical protein PKX69_10925 [Limnochordia bacterium]|nr:hypothetical protein [Limnochordia bacterium]